MRDEGDDRHRGSSSEPPAVGYKSPPVAHRFKKGTSGNKRGRPKKKEPPTHADHSVRDVEQLWLQEAYRLVTIREGDASVQLPAIQVAMRGLTVSAMKGNHRAQTALKKYTQEFEERRRQDKFELFQSLAEYKQACEDEFARCDRLGLPRPDPVPHPADIQIDLRRMEARIVGPQDELHKAHWEKGRARKKDSLEEIAYFRELIEREPELRKSAEEDIRLEQHICKVIDYYLPDEATRRSPLYDPNKRGKPPEKFKLAPLASLPDPATEAAVDPGPADPAE